MHDSPDMEYYYALLEPFKHYVPYMVHNATDVVQMVQWLRASEHDAKQIAKTGAEVWGGVTFLLGGRICMFLL
jgi:hypothetical protein